jgi:hypothetical protein
VAPLDSFNGASKRISCGSTMPTDPGAIESACVECGSIERLFEPGLILSVMFDQ